MSDFCSEGVPEFDLLWPLAQSPVNLGKPHFLPVQGCYMKVLVIHQHTDGEINSCHEKSKQ